jgi:hypothetical protein
VSGGVPDEVGGADGDEVDVYELVVVGPPVEVVNRVFEQNAQVVDREQTSQRVQTASEDRHDVQEVDAAPGKAPFQTFEHLVATWQWKYLRMSSKITKVLKCLI